MKKKNCIFASRFILVIKERDSSSVYYKISNGLVPPLSPEAAKRKKSIEEKQKYLESELKKRKQLLFNEAKGISLSPSTCTVPSTSNCAKSNSGNALDKNKSGDTDKLNDDCSIDNCKETNSKTNSYDENDKKISKDDQNDDIVLVDETGIEVIEL